jgi:RNA polymerase sigma-70 factor (ECF subfamily)
VTVDSNLIAQFEEVKANKEGAFERFLETIRGRVFSFSSRVCGNPEDAKDTLQETLTAAFRSLPQSQFADEKALNAWLYRVAKNACLMMRRKGKFEPERELSLDQFMPDGTAAEIPDWSEIPERQALKEETRGKIRRAVSMLPTTYRMVLVLRDIEQLSTRETAEILGITEPNVKARLHRARLFLRRELEEYLAGAKTVSKIGPKPPMCRQAFERLSEYVDGELDAETCRCIETHIEDCAPCVAFLRTLKKSISLCGDAGKEPAPPLAPQEMAQLKTLFLDWLRKETPTNLH